MRRERGAGGEVALAGTAENTTDDAPSIPDAGTAGKQAADFGARVAAARERDLRRVCLHEFAHQEVARLVGADGHVRIDRNPRGGLDELYFSGRFYISHSADAQSMRLVALAGCVAELLDEDHGFEGWQFFDALDADEIDFSDTDASLAGDFDEQDIDATAGLVLQAWESIERAAAFEARGWSGVPQ